MRYRLLTTREGTLLSEVWAHCVDLTSSCISCFRGLYLLRRQKKKKNNTLLNLRKFFTVFTNDCHWTLSWAIKSSPELVTARNDHFHISLTSKPRSWVKPFLWGISDQNVACILLHFSHTSYLHCPLCPCLVTLCFTHSSGK
jgi:hypothetical protein